MYATILTIFVYSDIHYLFVVTITNYYAVRSLQKSSEGHYKSSEQQK